MYKANNNLKSFTLIELLVVLALVAILSVVVVMTLNPAELLKQARDSNRLSDLATINTALNLFSADVTSGFMGTSTIVYVSIPDTSPTCANLGLPAIPTSTYTYNCVTTANLRNTNGTGWIPVNFQRISSNSPISQLPVDPINTTTSLNYYTYLTGGSWKLAATLEARKNVSVANSDAGTIPGSFEMGNNLTLAQDVFPSGWIRIPGDSRFGTSDFWVMKYEAKCADLKGNMLISPDSGAQTYDNSSTTPTISACTSANNRRVASSPNGYPLARIAQSVVGENNDAVEYCQSIGAHLITNNEWQTISWNTQGVSSNWSAGTMSMGNYNNTHASVASVDDTNGNYDTGYVDFGHKRTHLISNGQIIWDFAGNVWEFTDNTVTNGNQPQPVGWQEFNAVTNWGTISAGTVSPLNSAWTSSNGVGRVYSAYSAGGSTVYAFIRGGHWSTGGYSGVSALGLSYFPNSTSYASAGFRCVK